MNNQEKNKFKMWLLKTKQNRQKIEEKQLGITVYHIFMDEINKIQFATLKYKLQSYPFFLRYGTYLHSTE